MLHVFRNTSHITYASECPQETAVFFNDSLNIPILENTTALVGSTPLRHSELGPPLPPPLVPLGLVSSSCQLSWYTRLDDAVFTCIIEK